MVKRTRRGLAILAAIAGAIGTPGLPDDGQFHPYFLVFTIPGSVAAALAAANRPTTGWNFALGFASGMFGMAVLDAHQLHVCDVPQTSCGRGLTAFAFLVVAATAIAVSTFLTFIPTRSVTAFVLVLLGILLAPVLWFVFIAAPLLMLAY